MSFREFDTERGGGNVSGVSVAIVTDNRDPEEMGRVKLTYPWRDADDESDWARVTTPMAGPERGAYFLPEVDDEVLVAFENEDIHHPIVIGALWNGQQPPPETNADGENNVRTIRSRSGHEIRLDDTDGAANVAVRTSGGHEIRLDDTAGSETVTITDRSDQNRIAFDPNQGSISIESGATIDISAPAINVTGDGNVTIEANGMLRLKGAVVNIN